MKHLGKLRLGQDSRPISSRDACLRGRKREGERDVDATDVYRHGEREGG
jgi:hypothetical protein